MDELLLSLHSSEDEKQWMSLLGRIEGQTKQTKWGVLYVLKCLILRIDTVFALKNLMQILIRHISDMISDHNIMTNEQQATELFTLLRDFWALCSNQHSSITKQAFGDYSPELYDVLPSLASVYVDLFVAANRSKEKVEMLSKRLYAWLNFELNERCLKTALLEVSDQTSRAVTLLLPVLKKVLSSPPPKMSSMDYLLHFVLLRRWALVTSDLKDVVQVNLNLKAPKNFLDWLCPKWPNSSEHVPQDKSLKGRRVSELMCSLDIQAVEELIDVFSQCLSSVEEAVDKSDSSPAIETEVPNLFVIDKKGSEQDELPPGKKRKLDKTQEAIDLQAESGSVGEKNQLNGKLEKHSKESRGEKGIKQGSQTSSDTVLGFVLDRSAGNKKTRTGRKEEETEIEEEMEVDDGSDEEAEDDKDDEEEEEGSGEEEDGEEDDNDENEEGSNEEASTSASDDDEGVSEDEDSNNETSQDNSSNHRGKTRKTDVMASTLFSSGKDPATSYFANVPSKAGIDTSEPQIEIIDGMEIQTFEMGEEPTADTAQIKTKSKKKIDVKTAPDEGDKVSSTDEIIVTRKRKLSERKDESSQETSAPQSSRKSQISLRKTEEIPLNKGEDSQKVNTENELSVKKQNLDDATLTMESPKTRRSKRASESSMDLDNTKQIINETLNQNEEQEKPLAGSKKSRRLRSVSESSPGMRVVEPVSAETPRNTRRLKRNSESNVDKLQNKKSPVGATMEKIEELKKTTSSSPTKKQGRGKGEQDKVTSNESSGGLEVTEDQVGSVLSQIRMSMNEKIQEQEKTAASPYGTRRKTKSESSDTCVGDKQDIKRVHEKQSFTEIKVKIEPLKKGKDGSPHVLSEWLRKAPQSPDNVGGKQSHETKKRQKVGEEQSSSVQVKVVDQALSTITGSEDTSKESLSQSLSDVVNNKSMKTPCSVTKNQSKLPVTGSSHESSSDGEISFNPKSIGKTYSKSADRRGKSPKRILIEAKPKVKSPKTPDNKLPSPKVVKSNPLPSKSNKDQQSSNRAEKVATNPAAESTPKTSKAQSVGGDETGTPNNDSKSKKSGPGSQIRRKYYLRGASPVKSPTEEVKTPLSDSTEAKTQMLASEKTPRKSPAERRKSLRSASKRK